MNPSDGKADFFFKIKRIKEMSNKQFQKNIILNIGIKKKGRHNIQNGLSTNIVSSMKMVARMLVLMGDAPKIGCLLIQ